MPINSDILGTIGRTPLVKLHRMVNGTDATIAVKGEFFNPLGSVKDRIGAAMIAAAERDGKLIVTIGCSTGERYLSTVLAEEAKRQVTT